MQCTALCVVGVSLGICILKAHEGTLAGPKVAYILQFSILSMMKTEKGVR